MMKAHKEKMEIFNCEQGSSEWHDIRKGCVTASMFRTIQAMGRYGGRSKTRDQYLYKLASEIITGQISEDGYRSHHMERGINMETEARTAYSFITDNNVERVGFIRKGRIGCSPDALIGKNGALEIKTQAPHLLVQTINRNEFPSEHIGQCQGVLWITEREWIDVFVYWPGMHFLKRAHRDENCIKNISIAVKQFNEELDATVRQLRKTIG